MRRRIAPLLVICGVALLCVWAIRGPATIESATITNYQPDSDLSATVSRLNGVFESRWEEADLTPADPADGLSVLRRLTLSLMGTVPSIEEIRQFEADQNPDRLQRWTARILADKRFADYFADRLSRCFVGADGGQFIVFRRDRFTNWLSEQIHAGTPYDRIVSQMVGSHGLWTGQPESNFITAAVANEDLDENKLAARSVRAFLGQSIECAQCHNHFFAEWKQSQFEGLAAHFGQAEVSGLGVYDKSGKTFLVQDRNTLEDREVAPAVPFGSEWLPASGSPRERLAAWLTHPQNRRFERAIANRIWGLMFGRPFVAPVDDMPNPPDELESDVLDLLGQDFRQHDCDLRRMIQVIAASRPFQLASETASEDGQQIEALEADWGVFPVTRLRPEQIIGSMLQASFVQTINQNSHLIVRAIRFFRERDFVEAYGDLGDQELVERPGTIPQTLLRMNSDMTREAIDADPISSINRFSNMCETNRQVVELSYLACFSRRPAAEEESHFLNLLGDRDGDARETIVEDIFWTLFNSPEFSWNH